MKLLKTKNALKPKSSHVQLKRSLTGLFISMSVLMLMGCQQSIRPQALSIPPNLKQPCPDLLELESGVAKEVLKVMVDDRRKYVECSQKNEALIKAVS